MTGFESRIAPRSIVRFVLLAGLLTGCGAPHDEWESTDASDPPGPAWHYPGPASGGGAPAPGPAASNGAPRAESPVPADPAGRARALSACARTGIRAEISDPRHTLHIPVEDFIRGLPQEFTTEGPAGHHHTVSLGTEQFDALAEGRKVDLLTGFSRLHFHRVRLSCG